ncbi:GbsR/MarR family transcriptional regulator [candidate division CSSED10-310 bacterium]|uniref:HTH-type transcriptional regulator n=1 Tax=candidate division CSSED10-310 bacterium TaxID=2855610 RepID=A0ABV6Z1J4_UNCC1
MDAREQLKHEMIEEFGQAYRAFGMSNLMGHIVALLIYSPHALSLDEIKDHLRRSKGPVSQIVRRLTDRSLIRPVWTPGSRKSFYEIEPNIFANAFNNMFVLFKNNTRIAKKLKRSLAELDDGSLEVLKSRLHEMERFYEMMEVHYQNFLNEWAEERVRLKEQKDEQTGA